MSAAICTHDVVFMGLCAVCGSAVAEIVHQGGKVEAELKIAHDTAAITYAESDAKRTRTRLLRERRLILLCDLDQTLIHADVDPTIGEWSADPSNPNYPALTDMVRIQLSGTDRHTYYIKPRSNAREFLAEMNKLYELHVYTMGTREYAERVARVLDPEGIFFGDRVLDRTANESLVAKSVKRLFPTEDGEAMVVAVDDRAEVWGYADNLVKVSPFRFYPDVGDINNPYSRPVMPSAPEKGRTNSESAVNGDETIPEAGLDNKTSDNAREELMASLEKMRPLKRHQALLGNDNPVLTTQDDELQRVIVPRLRYIHEQFYRSIDMSRQAHVKDSIAPLRSSVLLGVRIVFSQCFAHTTEPRSTNHWKSAMWLGAECSTIFDAEVTHVVSRRSDTVKAREARRRKAFLVNDAWLKACVDTWTRVSETPYLLLPPNDREPPLGTAEEQMLSSVAATDDEGVEDAGEPLDILRLAATLDDEDFDEEDDEDAAMDGTGWEGVEDDEAASVSVAIEGAEEFEDAGQDSLAALSRTRKRSRNEAEPGDMQENGSYDADNTAPKHPLWNQHALDHQPRRSMIALPEIRPVKISEMVGVATTVGNEVRKETQSAVGRPPQRRKLNSNHRMRPSRQGPASLIPSPLAQSILLDSDDGDIDGGGESGTESDRELMRALALQLAEPDDDET